MITKRLYLWVIRLIRYNKLEFRKYNTWNNKMDYKLNILDKIRKCDTWNNKIDDKLDILDKIENILKTKDFLSNKYVKVMDF